jgi:spore coat polysaccharide biosynthesis protein SpsF
MAYVLGQEWIDSVVLGVDSISQLRDNLQLIRNQPLTEAECAYIEKELPEVPEKLLNPSQWNQGVS